MRASALSGSISWPSFSFWRLSCRPFWLISSQRISSRPFSLFLPSSASHLFRDLLGGSFDLFDGRLGSFLGCAGGGAHRVRHLFQNGFLVVHIVPQGLFEGSTIAGFVEVLKGGSKGVDRCACHCRVQTRLSRPSSQGRERMQSTARGLAVVGQAPQVH